MRSFDRRIDVSAALGASAPREIAATIHLPDEDGPAPTCLLFAFPGAGYNRRYFHLQWKGSIDRYSQAAHHVQRGIALAVCDHLGTGDSDAGETPSLEQIAAANALATSSIGEALANGTLLAGVKPLGKLPRIGAGHSLGGAILMLAQAEHPVFDGVTFLGSSAIQNVIPQPTAQLTDEVRRFYEDCVAGRPATPPLGLDYLFPFHREDVPEELRQADLAGGYPVRENPPPWGSRTIPPDGLRIMARDRLASAAAKIEVPVFLAFGDRDFSPDPRTEPAMFARSGDISLLVVPQMAHIHNFAGSRRRLWDRLSRWMCAVADAAAVNSSLAECSRG
jgi:alpha-beta hydrolase superfamily lysophospholipase